MARITIDPITRIEGHLRIDAVIEGGRVVESTLPEEGGDKASFRELDLDLPEAFEGDFRLRLALHISGKIFVVQLLRPR